MYKIGEFIIYGNEGVCEVKDISKISIPGVVGGNEYYTLKPMHDNGTIFTPIDTKVFMRPTITYDAIKDLIKEIPFIEKVLIDTKNIKLLQDYYKKLLNTHKCIDLLNIAVNLSNKKDNLNINGKKLNQIEENYLRIAKNLIEDEFSIVLSIPKDDICQYIENEVNKLKIQQEYE